MITIHVLVFLYVMMSMFEVKVVTQTIGVFELETVGDMRYISVFGLRKKRIWYGSWEEIFLYNLWWWYNMIPGNRTNAHLIKIHIIMDVIACFLGWLWLVPGGGWLNTGSVTWFKRRNWVERWWWRRMWFGWTGHETFTWKHNIHTGDMSLNDVCYME